MRERLGVLGCWGRELCERVLIEGILCSLFSRFGLGLDCFVGCMRNFDLAGPCREGLNVCNCVVLGYFTVSVVCIWRDVHIFMRATNTTMKEK